MVVTFHLGDRGITKQNLDYANKKLNLQFAYEKGIVLL